MTLDVFVCRRWREHSEYLPDGSPNRLHNCCAKNFSQEEFTDLQEKANELGAEVMPRGCLSVCPQQGFAFSIGKKRYQAKDMNDFEEKIEAYKKAKVSETSDGYSNR